jgi:hypothetical protein
MMKNVTRLPLQALVFYPDTASQGHFIVLVGKIVMVLLEKLKMELKYLHYDVMNVVFCKVFYNTKTKSDNRLSIMLIFRMKMVE